MDESTRTEARDLLVAWLNDAHAMEEAQIPVLKRHAKDAGDFPEVKARDEQHLEETRRHAELVKGCIEKLGERPSPGKDMLGSLMGTMQSVMNVPFQDRLVKNFLMDFTAENLEIASYLALIVAARELGEEEIANTCEQILAEEEAMAQWLRENLPMAVREGALHQRA